MTEAALPQRRGPGFWLRLTLITAGASALALAAASLLDDAGAPGTWQKLLIGCALASLSLGLARRVPDRAAAAGALALAALAGALRFFLHRASLAPLLDPVTALGVDPPRLLYLPGLMLLAGALRGALSRGAPGRPWLRLAALTGALMLSVYALKPQHFYMEQVDYTREGPMPVMVEGELRHHTWTRPLFPGRPLPLIPGIIYNDWTRADLAHGIRREMLESAPDSRQIERLAALWSAEKALAAGMFYAQGAALSAALGLIPLLLFGLSPGIWGIRLLSLPFQLSAGGVALANLALIGGCAISGLSGSELLSALQLNGGMLLAWVAAELAGRVLAAPRGGPG